MIDRLAIQYTLKQLRLIDSLVIRVTPEEALDYIEELHNDAGVSDGVAVLIFDFEQCYQVNFSVGEAVKMIRNEIINRRIPYTPKIVNLSSNASK